MNRIQLHKLAYRGLVPNPLDTRALTAVTRGSVVIPEWNGRLPRGRELARRLE
jgi:hypothetical protein